MDLDNLPSPYGAVAKLHQLFVGMLPRGWRSVDVTFERDEDFVRVSNLNVQAAAPGTPPPFTGLDQNASIAAINECFGDMADELEGAWSGNRARFSREAQAPELLLLDRSGQPQSRFQLDPSLVADLTLSDPLFDVIERAHAEFDPRQKAFDDAIRGFQRWDFGQDSGTLAFVLANGQPLEGRGVIVGSWASNDESWMWGWANDSVAPAFRTTMAAVRDAAKDAPGLAALRESSFGCAMPFASQLATIAGWKIGADGIFGGRHGGGAVFIAAMP